MKDNRFFNITFYNDGSYDEKCINMPIIDRRGKEQVVIGIITSVDSCTVTGMLWENYIHRELLQDGTPCSIEIS